MTDLTQQDIAEGFGAMAEIMREHGRQLKLLGEHAERLQDHIDVLETEAEVQQAEIEAEPVQTFAEMLRGAINGDSAQQDTPTAETPTATETPVQPLNALGLAIPAGLKDKKRNKVDAFVKAGNVSGLNDYMALSVDGSPLRLYASAALALLTRQPATAQQRQVAATVPVAVPASAKSTQAHGRSWSLSTAAKNSRRYRAKKDGTILDGETAIPVSPIA